MEAWSSIDSNCSKFSDYPLHPLTLKGLLAGGFVEPMKVQQLAIPIIISGKDIIAQAITGSGKTLAFLIPIMEFLAEAKIRRSHGPVVLIISPTRELCWQITSVLQTVAQFHLFTVLNVLGDKSKRDRAQEWNYIKHANIVVATPGRIIQHLEQNAQLSMDRVRYVVLDETDRLLDDSFIEQTVDIMEKLPEDRQTLLFSATQTQNLSNLTRLRLLDPVMLSAHFEEAVTPPNLHQYYLITPLGNKIEQLWNFLLSHSKKKFLVFCSSQKQVRFIYNVFREMMFQMRLYEIRGGMALHKRTKAIEQFNKKSSESSKSAASMGRVLLCTSVLERGIDFSDVDWVIQFDCPHTAEEYVHRVGRTARMNRKGSAVLFAYPGEMRFVLRLRRNLKLNVEKARLALGEGDRQKFDGDRFRCLVAQRAELTDMARYAANGYLQDYIMHEQRPPLRKVLPMTDLSTFYNSYGLSQFLPLPQKLSSCYKMSSDADSDGTFLRLNDSDSEENIDPVVKVASGDSADFIADSFLTLEENAVNQLHPLEECQLRTCAGDDVNDIFDEVDVGGAMLARKLLKRL